jgi:alanyl-tRNA synthetase
MRRAIYHGREHLGLNEPFFFKVCDFVVDQMREAYPELAVQREFIGKIVRLEEERFGNTVTVSLQKFQELIEQKKNVNLVTADMPTQFYPNDFAFLYDTYGMPIDLMYVLGGERGILLINPNNPYDIHPEDPSKGNQFVSKLTEEEFRERIEQAIKEFQKRSGIGHTQRKSEINPIYAEMLVSVGANKFHGYETTRFDDARVVGILDGDKQLDTLNEDEQGSVILDQTPFYAESGGQVGDVGVFIAPPATAGGTDFKATVADTYSPVAGLIIHKVRVESGTLKVGDRVMAVVDSFKRDATRRNHTATHLLHAALKEVLGTHVKQAGSVVAPNYLRFDFSHYQPMSDSEIQEVEDLVNRYILQNHTVTTNLMTIEDAMRSGAVAMFGEKYGAEVRVLSVGDGKFSMELCGGTHVRATGDIGSFKITSDEAIASGVRRIRAITGFDAFERFREDERLIDRSLEALKTQRDNLPNAIERLQEEVKRTRKEIEELKLKIATGAANGTSSNEDEAREIAGVKVLAKVVDGLDANGQRQLSDTLLARLKSGVVVLGRNDEGKASIIVRVSDDLKDRVKAGNVIKEIVPVIGGKGGGRPDMAEGGGPDADRLNEAMEAGYKVIETFLSP